MYLVYRVGKSSSGLTLLSVKETIHECRKFMKEYLNKHYPEGILPFKTTPDEAFKVGRVAYLFVDEDREMKRVLHYLTSWEYNYKTITNAREEVLLKFLEENGVKAETEHDGVLSYTYLVKRA